MKKLLVLSLAAGMAALAGAAKQPVDYVNPELGNISHMLVPTFPLVHRPNACYRFHPSTYSHVDERMPPVGLFIAAHRQPGYFQVHPFRGALKDAFGGWRGTWDQQHAKPYEYSVRFDEEKVRFRLAPAARGAIAEFSFAPGGSRTLVFSPRMKGGACVVKGASLDMVDVFPKDFPLHLHGEFSPAPTATEAKDGKVAAVFDSDVVTLRFAVSLISSEQARRNFDAELPGKTLDALSAETRDVWNRTLSQIEVEGGTEDERTVFYTALYRCYERMCDFTEDGKYMGYDRKVHDANGVGYYCDDWTWDTYRAAHPLMCLLKPSLETAKLASYLRNARESEHGWLPTFPDISGDMHGMNGMHVPALFLDAMNKGIGGVDYAEAYRAVAHTLRTQSHLPWFDGPKCSLDEFEDAHGYFPALHPGPDGKWQKDPEWPAAAHHNERRQAVAVTLAYSYDSWCAARLAEKFGTPADVEYFNRRSRHCWNLWKDDTKFFHPKDKDGKWIEPFDYSYSGGSGARDYYDENNGWTYIWDVQHALPELIERLGGPAGAVAKLDAMLTEPYRRPRWHFYYALPDSTGNMGMFTMGNEPSFHIPYIYNFCGRPDKTQKFVRKVLKCWFRNDLMGVCGDEDGGGMSAFAVFSMMGFYPVTPGIPEYQWGSPVFRRVVIHLENGRDFVLEAPAASEDAKYVGAITLDGRCTGGALEPLHHSDLMRGVKVKIEMHD